MASDATSTFTLIRSGSIYTVEQVYRAAIALNLPVAAWRLPETNTVRACVSLQAARPATVSLEDSPFGFVFSPFVANETQPNLFIQGDICFCESTGELKASITSGGALDSFLAALDQDLEGIKWHLPVATEDLVALDEAAYTQAVDAAIEAIKQEQMEKVVISRNSTQQLPDQFHPVKAFRKMLDLYPRAFVSLVSIPGIGTWLGASPEILVSIDQQQVFRTVALAGTQPANDETNLGNAIWRQKEIEEQGMVERYVLSCFKKLRLREYTEVGPRTIVAGNLMHLRTDFKVDLKEVDFPNLGTDMLALLHPTSAICGLPKEPALDFILQHEGYNRSYYSGFLGPVNSADGTHIFVNLRCMQLLSTEAILYAGAGITAESSPEKEYQETAHKMQTMLKILSAF